MTMTDNIVTAEQLQRWRMHAEYNLHRIEFKIDDGDIRAEIVCRGGGATACHMTCTRCDSEHCACDYPELVDTGRCLWVEELTYNNNPIDNHSSEHPQVLRNSGIIVWWDGEWKEYLWTYKEPQP